MQEAHKSLILVKGQSKQCGKELVDNIKYSEEVHTAAVQSMCQISTCKVPAQLCHATCMLSQVTQAG